MSTDAASSPASSAASSRARFGRWLTEHGPQRLLLVGAGEVPDRRRLLGGLTRLMGLQRAAGYVYVLMEHRPGDEVPACIGAAADPRRVWAAHLNGLGSSAPGGAPGGASDYGRWRRRLLREGHGTARHDLSLLVVGTGTPEDADALRAELARLAEDACPLPLLAEPDR